MNIVTGQKYKVNKELLKEYRDSNYWDYAILDVDIVTPIRKVSNCLINFENAYMIEENAM
jgi:hypothetical protein